MALEPTPKLTEGVLTKRQVNGTGLFDGLMEAIKKHLHEEFDAERLSGKEYAEAYAQLTAAALSGAIQFLIQRDTAYLEGEKLRQEIAKQEYEFTYLLPKQLQKIDAEIIGLETDNQVKNAQRDKLLYEVEHLMPKELVKIDAEITGITSDNAVKAAQVDKIEFEVESLLPKELEKVTAEITGMTTDNAVKTAQKEKIEYEVEYLLPKELQKVDAEILGMDTDNLVKLAQKNKIEFEVEFLLPKELEKADAQIIGMETDNMVKLAQKNLAEYELTEIMPIKKATGEIDKDIKVYQLSDVLPAEVANRTADTVSKEYNNNFILPATLDNIKEQTEGNRAKTLNVRSDGTPVEGAIGKQNQLYDQQITSYMRDAESKFFKMVVDTWQVQRSTDEDAEVPAQLNNVALNDLTVKMRSKLGLDTP